MVMFGSTNLSGLKKCINYGNKRCHKCFTYT